MINILKARRQFRSPASYYRLETGFSMLEAVVVVGVLLALAVGGFFAYGPIAENAKKAAVKAAASEVHTAVVVASIDGDSSTDPQDVIDSWNGSTDQILAAIVEPPGGGLRASGDFCVSATNVENPHITAREGDCGADDTGSGDGTGSNSSVTFSNFVAGPNLSPQGAEYLNARLTSAASAATLSQDWDLIQESSEYKEQEAARSGLTYFEIRQFDNDPYTRVDSDLPTLYSDYDLKLATFNGDPTVANQQAMVTAYQALLTAAVDNPIADNVLYASPSYPEMFKQVTVSAGSNDAAVARFALPTSLYSSNNGVELSSLPSGIQMNDVSNGIDGDYTYYDLPLSAEGGSGWQVGTYDFFITATDNRGVSHSTDFRIIVE